MRDGLSHPQRIGVGRGSVNAQLHHVRNAFAIGNNLARQRRADLRERLRKLDVPCFYRRATRTGRQQQHRVVR